MTSPLLILHAEDDNIVPYRMGLEVHLILLLSSAQITSCMANVAVSFLNDFAFSSCLQLYQISLQTQKQQNTDAKVEMISYAANHGFSHNGIYLDPNLSNVVQ